jgi:uncharacterized protein involved in exopolysaccharide biosynthesis
VACRAVACLRCTPNVAALYDRNQFSREKADPVTAIETAHANTADDIDLLALWRIVWRYKWLVVAIAFACAIVAAVVALTATPSFRAEVTVTEVRDDGMGSSTSLMNQFGGLASLVGVNLATDGAAQEARAVLESRRLIEEFIRRNVSIEALIPSADERTLWRAVKRFRESVLTIREDTRKGRTTVSINWTDPETAARWANQFVALANELVRVRALNESNRNIAYLNEQLAKTNVLELRRVMFNLIETETKRLMLANGRIEYAFTVVDPAVAPEIRSSPRRTLMVICGGLLGGFLGVIVAFVHNAVTRSRRGALHGHT